MSNKIKTCGKRFHEAEGPVCKCWCCGVFHGAAGKENRAQAADIISKRFKMEIKVDGCSYKPSYKQERIF